MLNVIIRHTSMIPIYEQLTGRIRAAVASGELKAGEALPSVRALAAELEISALTVKKAYDRLEEEGIVVTVQGKGSFVSETNAGLVEENRRREAEKALAEAIERARAAGYGDADIRELVELILEDR